MSIVWAILKLGWWAVSALVGFVLGALSSVYFKRHFEKWLDRPKLEISSAYSMKMQEGAMGLTFCVTNRGEKPLEPFKIALCFPHVQLAIFARDNDARISKGQRVNFIAILFKEGKPSKLFSDAIQMMNTFKAEQSTAVFRVIEDQTDGKVIFESATIGNALARVLACDWEHKGLRSDAEALIMLRHKPENDLQWVLRKGREFVKTDFRNWFSTSVEFVMARQWLKCLFGVVVMLLIVTISLAPLIFARSTQEAASVGDSFGLASALFTGLAFAGTLWAIFLQRREIKSNEQTQNDALENQRQQLLLQTEQATLQTKQLEIQAAHARAAAEQVKAHQLVARVQALTALAHSQHRISLEPIREPLQFVA